MNVTGWASMTNTEDRLKAMAQFPENVVLLPEFQNSINEARRIRAAQELGQLQAQYGLVQSRMQNKTAQESAASQRAVLAHDLQLRREDTNRYEGYRKDNDAYRALRAMYFKNMDPPTPREWAAAKKRFKDQGVLGEATEAELDAEWTAHRNALKQEAGNAARAVDIFNREAAWLRDPANKANPELAKRSAANEELRKQLEGRVGLFDTSTGRMESMARGPREDPIEPRLGPGAAPQFGVPGPTPSPAPESVQPKTSFWDGFGKAGTAAGGAFDQFFGSLGGGGSRSAMSPSFPPPSYQEPPNTGQPFVPGYSSTDETLRLTPGTRPIYPSQQPQASPFLPQFRPGYESTFTPQLAPQVQFVPPPPPVPVSVGSGADFSGQQPMSYWPPPAWTYSPIFSQRGLLGPGGLAGQGVFGQRNMMPFVPQFISTDTPPRGMQPYLP